MTSVARALLIAGIALATVSPLSGQRDTIQTGVDLVVVPVSVKNAEGRFVYDLEQKDFTILEDEKPQEIAQFSIDPAPLSVAVLVDTGVDGAALRRLSEAIVSLSSAFTPMDEAEIYRFDKFVTKLSDFTNDYQQFEKSLAIVQTIGERARQGPTSLAVIPSRGPRWLRWLLRDGRMDTRLLNDALFTAALDLEKRAPANRKMVIVISDGQAVKNIYSFGEVRDRLVESQIQIYAVTVSLPVLDIATSILPAYSNATGGDVYSGRTRDSMQSAFSRITEQVRHQYVLSYVSNNEVSGTLPVTREIEVKTSRPGLAVRHRTQYLQYPPRR
jgi:VWFA-related protein